VLGAPWGVGGGGRDSCPVSARTSRWSVGKMWVPPRVCVCVCVCVGVCVGVLVCVCVGAYIYMYIANHVLSVIAMPKPLT
jgi:hypothetical protein